MTKKISILGSTGSIGRNTLEIVAKHPGRFEVVGLAAGGNVELLTEQVKRFRPSIVSVRKKEDAALLAARLDHKVDLLSGEEGALAVAAHPDAELVMSAIVGAAGLRATFAAVESGKNIALANKEAMVIGGALLADLVKQKGVKLLPVDSEHSAIFQSLQGHRPSDVRKLILTASGGPFWTKGIAELCEVTVEQALAHPNWSMGQKITIDSATMMNKGLEVIEAHWLFDIPATNIEVIVHPQSIIHSMVEYRDGCTIAQLGLPDMRAPIAYALAFPERIETELPPLKLAEIQTLSFEEPDHERFPALRLAYQALEAGESMPTVMNAANEMAVKAFLAKKIRFLDIPRIISESMESHELCHIESLEHLLEIDASARKRAEALIGSVPT